MSPQLLVIDLERSITFYTEVLEFNVDFRYEDFYCGISKDGHPIHLKQAKPNIEERKNRRDNEHVDISFAIEEIENLYETLLSRATEITQPLREMPYGKEFYIADPDGYILSFLEET